MRINPFYLHGEEFTPVRKLLALHALAGGVPLKEYTETGNPVTFETNVAKPLSECLLSFLPVQSGTGDPSPDNVRSISGISSANVYLSDTGTDDPDKQTFAVTFPALGKNLFDKNAAESGKLWWKGRMQADVDYYASALIPVIPGETYTLAKSVSGQNQIQFFGEDGTYIEQNLSWSTTKTIPSGVYFVAFNIRTAAIDDAMFVKGTSAGSYEPFTNTAYGGTLDLATGILTVTWAGFSKKWSEGTNATDMGSGITRKQYPMVDNLKTGSAYNLCNIAPYQASENAETHFYYSGSGATNRNCRMFLPSDTDDDTEITVITNISVPIVYQLTPQEIQTLIGTNVIWSDTNTNMTVKYLKKG